MTEKAKAMLNREFVVKFWHLLLVAIAQFGGVVWFQAKLDARVEVNTRSIATEHGINVVQAEQLKVIESTRFKDTDGRAVTEMSVRNRERLSVVESDMKHLQEDTKDIKKALGEVLAILREK